MKDNNINIEIFRNELLYLIDAISSSDLPTKRCLSRILNILKIYEKKE